MTGYRTDTCPWAGFDDPTVIAVMEARQLAEVGLLAAEDPPNHVIEGMILFDHVLTAIRNHDMEQQRKDALRKRGAGGGKNVKVSGRG